MRKSVVIVGGGISGLAAAYTFQKYAREKVDFRVVDSAARLGGKIRSIHEGGFTVEGGPDSFLPRKTAILDLCRWLGLEDQLIEARNGAGIFVWSDGRLIAMPEGLMMMAPTRLGDFLKSDLISWPGKIRMGLEALIPRRMSDDDESLGSFVRRRLGQEALDKIAGPLFAGIYSGDPETLSLRSTFPLFAEMERKHGGLVRAMLAQKKAGGIPQQPGAKRTSFVSLRGGMQTMVDALVAQLPVNAMLCGRRVVRATKHGRQWEVLLDDGRGLTADAVLFATPAFVTANALDHCDSHLVRRLRAIRYVSTATVSLGFQRTQIPHSLNGTGFIVSQREKARKITACTWSSVKFEDRAPDGCCLVRVFLGGARAPEMANLAERDLVSVAVRELRETMGIVATPMLAKAFRWPQASPQYAVGHRDLVKEIETLAAGHEGLSLAGAAYHGAGLPDCVHSGIETAQTILKRWADDPAPVYAVAGRLEAK